MKFDELDKKMRVYETSHDYLVPPEIYLVARLDGRSFTRLTKEIHKFEAPFDLKFRDLMVETSKHLMSCGFKITSGYAESDEISLLFHFDDNSFSRKTRKLNPILAGEASAHFSLRLGSAASFDRRISELPNQELVIDYFRWRNEDAHSNALNAHCYWLLRNNGQTSLEATDYLSQKSVAYKNEFLFQNGINFNELPSWQKRGIGVYWESILKEGFNPITKKTVSCRRQSLKVDFDLPMKEAYSEFIAAFLN